MSHECFTIVFASDDRGVLPLGVAIYSLISNAGNHTAYKIYVLDNNITSENKNKILALLAEKYSLHRIIFVNVIEQVGALDLPVTDKWPITTWTRVLIPDLLPNENGLVLYCDIDLLFCRDLTELFHTPLGGKAMGVVLEHRSHEGSHFNERLGIPLSHPGYFNAGVILMDLQVFRERSLVKRILDFAAAHREQLTCLDQDALNGALSDEIMPINHKWNWHDGLTRLLLKHRPSRSMLRGVPLQEAIDAALHPGILHFQGPNKPWRFNYRIERRRYRDALIQSGLGTDNLPGFEVGKWLKAVMYEPIYVLTWWKIRRMNAKLKHR
ncbi:MAG: glycosyltransferase family 8 protein [Thiobacillus sp.]